MRPVNIIATATLLAVSASGATTQSVFPEETPLEKPVNATGYFDWLPGGGKGQWEVAPVPRPPARNDEDRPRHNSWQQNGAGTYRTLCVRLCDGFYFPIGFATTNGKFAEDARQCERLCPSRSRLFAYRHPGRG